MALQKPSDDEQLAELYRSVPLETGTRIRVLHLLPRTHGSSIYLKLKVVDLDSEPIYQALSYTWGKSSEGRYVFVNGIYRVSVTDNLFNALHGLRRRLKVRVLWVDQLCINQSDLKERERQVALMGRVYSEAVCTNVWLGIVDSWVSPLSFGPMKRSIYKTSIRPQNHERRLNVQALRGFVAALRNRDTVIHQTLTGTEPWWHSRAWSELLE